MHWLGSVFTFEKVEGGFVHGSFEKADGSVMKIKKTCGHIQKFNLNMPRKRARKPSAKAKTQESKKKKEVAAK